MPKYQPMVASLLILLALLNVLPLRSTSATGQTQIVVNGADAVLTKSNSPSSNLSTMLQSTQPRIVVEYSNEMNKYRLSGSPSALQTMLSETPKKITIQYANDLRKTKLVYPRTLLNDTTAPLINNFANTIDGTSAKVTWDTNEFTRCTLCYGTQPGNYTGTIDEALYAKQHTATLSNVTLGAIYYVQATCVDQSDNSATSTEFSFGTDKIAPEINAPSNAVTGKDVTVTWQTNEPATTQLRYGTAPGNYTQTTDVSGYATTHTLTLNNLADGTYYAQIASKDQSGNEATSAEFSFVIDTTPPQISDIHVGSVTANGSTIAWMTNEPATAIIEFGTQPGNYTNSVTAPTGTDKQQFTLPGLAWGTTYFVRLRITDSHGNMSTSAEFTLTTKRPVFLPLIRR